MAKPRAAPTAAPARQKATKLPAKIAATARPAPAAPSSAPTENPARRPIRFISSDAGVGGEGLVEREHLPDQGRDRDHQRRRGHGERLAERQDQDIAPGPLPVHAPAAWRTSRGARKGNYGDIILNSG